MIAKAVSLLAVFLSLSQAGLNAYVEQTSLGGMLYLVNRRYVLSRQYEPPDLVAPRVSGGDKAGNLLRQEAALALEELFTEASAQGYELVASSGYRSYKKQATIWDNKVKQAGRRKAALYVAPPGASEHQLGLAMDLARKSNGHLNAAFGKSEEGRWVADNAHRFGYIVRYREKWTEITGYADEPWHIRYVGKEHAQAIHELDIPLETYVQQLSAAAFGEYLSEDGR